MTLPYSERVRQRLMRRLHTTISASEQMGIDRKLLWSFRSSGNGISLATLDKIVAWLDEQDALDEQARQR